MKLISLNVGLFEENNSKLKQFFESQQPDIICLQEVTRRIDKNALEKYMSKDPIDEVTSNLDYSFFAPDWVMDGFEVKNFHGKDLFKFDLGGFVEFGKYIKSKFKIVRGHSIFIQNSFSLITTDYWDRWPEDDCKSIQLVDLILDNGQKLRILNYHGIWSKEKMDSELTLKASQMINDLAKDVNYPVIICGDFNLFPNTKSMLNLKNNFISLVDEFNIKTTRPSSDLLSNKKRNIVDYIFVSKDIKVDKFEVLDSEVSDHFPLILDFVL